MLDMACVRKLLKKLVGFQTGALINNCSSYLVLSIDMFLLVRHKAVHEPGQGANQLSRFTEASSYFYSPVDKVV